MTLFSRMGFIFFASVAAASADADECEAHSPATLGAKEPSMLQIGNSRVAVSEEQLENERARENTIIEGIVKRRQIQLAGMVKEGMREADAVSLMRSFAGSMDRNTFKNEDLSSDADLHTLFVDQMSGFHSILCHIRRGTSDCEAEYTQVMTDAWESVVGAAASLAQYVTGIRHETKAKQLTEQGWTDPVLLAALEDELRKSMMYKVKLGEDEDAMKDMVAIAMRRISDMDDASLLAYTDHTKGELTSEYVLLGMETICSHTMGSCSQRILHEISEISGLAQDAGVSIGASLLQTGLRAVVKLLMKVFDLPEHPKETQAERSAAIKALLMAKE